MKINVVEERKIRMSSEMYLKILEMMKKGKGYTCKIDGQPYYLKEMNAFRMGEIVDATFTSINSADFIHSIEIEVTADEQGKIG
jgi:hypothetical protein